MKTTSANGLAFLRQNESRVLRVFRFDNGASALLTAEEANDLRMRLQELWIAGKLR